MSLRPKAHQTIKNTWRPKAQTVASDIRAGQRWREVSELKRRRNPICEDPFGIHKRMGVSQISEQVHHVKPLLTHPELAYVMTNLMAVCTKCHSMLEAKEKTKMNCEYICVYGAPASGKSTYVNEHKQHGELVLDVDALYRALGCDTRDHPQCLMPFVLDMRDAVLSRLKQPHTLKRVWIITTTKRVAEWCTQTLNARMIQMRTSQDECIRRAEAATERHCVLPLHKQLIEEWFKENHSV